MHYVVGGGYSQAASGPAPGIQDAEVGESSIESEGVFAKGGGEALGSCGGGCRRGTDWILFSYFKYSTYFACMKQFQNPIGVAGAGPKGSPGAEISGVSQSSNPGHPSPIRF